MRRIILPLCLSLSLGVTEAVGRAGPALPSPYRVQETRNTVGGQLIVGSSVRRFTAQAGFAPAVPYFEGSSLLVLRDPGTGQTLWKRYVGGEVRLKGVGGHIIELAHTGGI